MKLTRMTWNWLIMGPVGVVAMIAFAWWLSGQVPDPKLRHTDALIILCISLWVVGWIVLGWVSLRERGQWVITKHQETKLKDQLEAQERRVTDWSRQRLVGAREREVEEIYASLVELRRLESEYGDAGTVAFILGEPVEDILRVIGRGDCE